MLINTVILFLRDALPIFILLSLLASLDQIRLRDKMLLVVSLAGGALGALLIVNAVGVLSSMFGGAGMELFHSFIAVLFYLLISCLVLMVHTGNVSKFSVNGIVFSVIVLVTATNGADFLVFLTGYWSQYGAAQSLILGIVLGLGISTSFSILLYFFVGWLLGIGVQRAPHVLLVLFAAGQVGHAVNLLSQVDLITSSPVLWDTSHLVSDSSEWGHLLASLFGYEASPSLVQVLVNAAAAILPVLALILTGTQRKNTSTKENGGSR